jgi:aerobic C4-dicarboxylate transport protein
MRNRNLRRLKPGLSFLLRRLPLQKFHPIFLHLSFWVLLAIIAGILTGHFHPVMGMKAEILGKGFIELIKFFIGPIIFLTISSGIAAIGDLKRVGRIGLKALIYFELVTTLALVIGVGVALLLKPGEIDKPGIAIQNAEKYVKKAGSGFSWMQFLQENTTLQILLFAIAFGILLCFLPARERVLSFMHKISYWVFTALKYLMYAAPLGAFGGMAFAVGKFGLASIVPLAKLMGCLYITMALFIFFILGSIMRFYGLRIGTFLSFIKEEILIVLGTSSSETAMPGLMQKLEKMGCAKPVVGLVVPTGYSFNLDGTSIYLSMAVIFIAQLYAVPLSFQELAVLIGILMLTSKGAAGVTGSGFVVLASTLASLQTIPLEGLAFLLGVDKFMSEARAITNLIGNGVATLVIAKSEDSLVLPQSEAPG